MTQTTPVDLYSLPEEIVVRFWKNFENAVREITNVKTKLGFVNLVIDEPCAMKRIRMAFDWEDSPEGREYWEKVYNGHYSK